MIILKCSYQFFVASIAMYCFFQLLIAHEVCNRAPLTRRLCIIVCCCLICSSKGWEDLVEIKLLIALILIFRFSIIPISCISATLFSLCDLVFIVLFTCLSLSFFLFEIFELIYHGLILCLKLICFFHHCFPISSQMLHLISGSSCSTTTAIWSLSLWIVREVRVATTLQVRIVHKIRIRWTSARWRVNTTIRLVIHSF